MELFYISVLIIITIGGLWFFYFKPSRKKDTDITYMDALNAMLLADKRKAIALLSNIVKKDSEHINAYLQLGNLIREDDPDRAIKIHQMLTVRQKLQKDTKIEILKLDKSNIWACSFLLMIAEKTEDWDYAELRAKNLQKLKGFDEKINLSRYTMQKGIDFLKNNNLNEADSLFRKAINDSPSYGLPYKYLGDIKHLNRDLVKAVENWERYIDLSPQENYKVFDRIETALFDLGRYSEVEKFYRKVLDVNPNDINAAQRLANVLNEKGENKAALALVDQFIEGNKLSISLMLMKLKLSLLTKTPAELGYYVDEILSKLKNENN